MIYFERYVAAWSSPIERERSIRNVAASSSSLVARRLYWLRRPAGKCG